MLGARSISLPVEPPREHFTERLATSLEDYAVTEISRTTESYLRDHIRHRGRSRNGLFLPLSMSERSHTVRRSSPTAILPFNPAGGRWSEGAMDMRMIIRSSHLQAARKNHRQPTMNRELVEVQQSEERMNRLGY